MPLQNRVDPAENMTLKRLEKEKTEHLALLGM